MRAARVVYTLIICQPQWSQSRDSCVSRENKQKRESLQLSLLTHWALRADLSESLKFSFLSSRDALFSFCRLYSKTKNARQLSSKRAWPQIKNKLIRQRRRVSAFIWANLSFVHLKFTFYCSLSLFAESYEVEVYSLFLKLYTFNVFFRLQEICKPSTVASFRWKMKR